MNRGCSLLILSLFALSFSTAAQDEKSSPCFGKDPSRHVTGGKECLVYKTFGLATAGRSPGLVVFIHGDVSAGGPATYMFDLAARSAQPGLVSVALLRPGYYDAEGNKSTGSDNGRRDNYTAHNVDAIASAIGLLKERFGAKRTFLVGHSGGGAVSGIIIGKHPNLADGALIVSCPCNMQEWYWQRGWQSPYQSLSAHDFVAKIPQGARVIVVSGEVDNTVYADISKKYAGMLTKRGIRAEYREIPNGTHRFNTLASSPLFSEVLVLLLEDVARLGKE